MLLASGVGCFVASPRVGLYRVSPQRLHLSLKSVSFWQVASKADAAKCVNSTATAFLAKRDAVLWRPFVRGNVFEHFSTPQNRPCIWVVVATLS